MAGQMQNILWGREVMEHKTVLKMLFIEIAKAI